MSNLPSYRVAVVVVSLLGGCSFVFHDQLVHARDHTPVIADALIATAALIAGVGFVAKAQQDVESCNASSQNDDSAYMLSGALACPFAGFNDALIAGTFTTVALAFAASAVYGQSAYKTAGRDRADQLTGGALAAAHVGDCAAADAVALEIHDLDQATYHLLVADPSVRVCVQRGCAARREAVFDRARAADSHAQRIRTLADLPTCEL